MTTTTYPFTAAYNERAGQYEIHAPGCAHLGKAHIDPMMTVEAPDAEAAAVEYERQNEECFATPSPCARKVGR